MILTETDGRKIDIKRDEDLLQDMTVVLVLTNITVTETEAGDANAREVEVDRQRGQAAADAKKSQIEETRRGMARRRLLPFP